MAERVRRFENGPRSTRPADPSLREHRDRLRELAVQAPRLTAWWGCPRSRASLKNARKMVQWNFPASGSRNESTHLCRKPNMKVRNAKHGEKNVWNAWIASSPGKKLEKQLARKYSKGKVGRKPYPLSVMLRIHVMQILYNLSDPAMEDALYEIESMRRFAGLRLSDNLPDETTILNFRHFLERNKSGQRLFDTDSKALGLARIEVAGRQYCRCNYHCCTHLYQESRR